MPTLYSHMYHHWSSLHRCDDCFSTQVSWVFHYTGVTIVSLHRCDDCFTTHVWCCFITQVWWLFHYTGVVIVPLWWSRGGYKVGDISLAIRIRKLLLPKLWRSVDKAQGIMAARKELETRMWTSQLIFLTQLSWLKHDRNCIPCWLYTIMFYIIFITSNKR